MSNSEIFEMFVVTHKKIFYKLIKNYIPIQVGNNKKFRENYLKDDSGDNISEKNSNYCELTAIYWLWKNYNLPKYIGICHYRRFFIKRPLYRLVDEKYVLKNLNKYDIILPYPYKTKKNVKNHFINSISGKEKDIDRLELLIKNSFSEYYDDFCDVMKGKAASYANMFIMNKNNYIEYCEWLFKILFEFEKTTDLTDYTVQEARIYGYMSEFLLNVWVKHKKLRIKYCNIILVESNVVKMILKKARCFFRDIKRLIEGKL